MAKVKVGASKDQNEHIYAPYLQYLGIIVCGTPHPKKAILTALLYSYKYQMIKTLG